MNKRLANKWAYLGCGVAFLALSCKAALVLGAQLGSHEATTASGAFVGGLVLVTGAAAVFCIVRSKSYAN